MKIGTTAEQQARAVIETLVPFNAGITIGNKLPAVEECKESGSKGVKTVYVITPIEATLDTVLIYSVRSLTRTSSASGLGHVVSKSTSMASNDDSTVRQALAECDPFCLAAGDRVWAWLTPEHLQQLEVDLDVTMRVVGALLSQLFFRRLST